MTASAESVAILRRPDLDQGGANSSITFAALAILISAAPSSISRPSGSEPDVENAGETESAPNLDNHDASSSNSSRDEQCSKNCYRS